MTDKTFTPWKIVHLTTDAVCISRDIFYPETRKTIKEHVYKENGLIHAMTADEAMKFIDGL